MIRSAFREKRVYQLHCPNVAEFRKVLEKIRPCWEEATFWVNNIDLLYEPETDQMVVTRVLVPIPITTYCYPVEEFFNKEFVDYKPTDNKLWFQSEKYDGIEPKSGPCLVVFDLAIDDKWCRLVGDLVRKIPNYESMIFNLETKGLVKTTSTTGYMAFSAYKFCFADKEVFYDGSTFYDVDCLGTTLCSDITEKVKTLHLENFGC